MSFVDNSESSPKSMRTSLSNYSRDCFSNNEGQKVFFGEVHYKNFHFFGLSKISYTLGIFASRWFSWSRLTSSELKSSVVCSIVDYIFKVEAGVKSPKSLSHQKNLNHLLRLLFVQM